MRRKLILSVAYDKFSEKGYIASLSEIAKDSGIKKQTLYNYYENKDELFFEMIKIEAIQYFTEMQQQFMNLDTKDSKSRLEQIFKLLMNYFKDRNRYRFWRWLIVIDSEPLIAKCNELTNEYKKDFLAILKDTFSTGIKNGEIREQSIESLIDTFIVLVHGSLDAQVFYGNLIKRESFVQNVWETFWNGISIKS